jgi:hypothetical protein
MPTATISGAAILEAHRDEMINFMIDHGAGAMLAELSIDQLWERWSNALVKERRITRSYAEHCLSEALRFLHERRQLADTPPGPVADVGWHLMLHHDTRAYAAVCNALAGRYVHHLPSDIAGFNDFLTAKCNDTNDGGSTSKCVCS